MKKAISHTKCTVKLRKAENAEEWYLVLESYLVFKKGLDKPSRIIEGLNRKITTPIWDKSRSALKQAFVDGYFTVDLAAKVKNIPEEETRREYVTLEELNLLAKTPCDNPVIKNAALFSALTGLRHCDIKKLTWSEIAKVDGGSRLDFRQKKTKGVEYNPISEQALQLCGPRRDPDQLVFEDLPKPSWISKPLARWIKSAGITRHITFHCFRHTYATLQLANGIDIYTVSSSACRFA